MSEAENRLYGLMVVVEGQQKAVQAALEGLQAERGLLQGEREAQAREMAAMAERQQAATGVVLERLARERVLLQGERDALARGVAAVETSTAAAASAAVNTSLAGAATIAAAAVERGARPLLEKLGGVVEGAEQAQAALRRVVLWASWRLLEWVMAVAAALMLLAWLGSTAVLWWDGRAIMAAGLEKAQLQIEVTKLRANYDTWVNAGMLERLQRCGPDSRPCVRVDESAGRFVDGDLRVIKGY